jgi:6-phosphogluconolactonase
MNATEPKVDWRESTSERAWVDGAVRSIRDAIDASLRDLQARTSIAARTLLLLSGGSTPAPLLRALAIADVDWRSVVVSLVDERDVAPDDAASNARLVRETLLRERAAAATFWPLREGAPTLDAAVAHANRRWREARLPIAAIVFGMGDDAHTASLFPGAPDLPVALASDGPYVKFDAQGRPGAGRWPWRITLTPPAWRAAGARLMLLRGAPKRAVFERALVDADVLATPVLAVVDVDGPPLQLHWCAA